MNAYGGDFEGQRIDLEVLQEAVSNLMKPTFLRLISEFLANRSGQMM